MSAERRLRKLIISPELICNVLSSGNLIQAHIEECIPPGSGLAGAGMTENGQVFVLVEHSSFKCLVEGEDIPFISARFSSWGYADRSDPDSIRTWLERLLPAGPAAPRVR